jgi:hypothetical protein
MTIEGVNDRGENWWMARVRADRRSREPCPDTVRLAAMRAARWARDNTTLSAAEIIDLDLAIRDLAGPV